MCCLLWQRSHVGRNMRCIVRMFLSRVRKQRGEYRGSALFLLFVQCRIPACGTVPSLFMVDLLILIYLVWNPSHSHVHMLTSYLILDSRSSPVENY